MLRRFVFVTAACASLLFSNPGHADATSAPAEPVTVTKVTFDRSGNASLRLNVASGGCTHATDFRVVVTTRGSGQALRIDRLRADVCEMDAPQGATIDVPAPGLHRGSIFVENPLFVGH